MSKNPYIPKRGTVVWFIALHLPRRIRLAVAMQWELARDHFAKETQ